MPARVRIDTPDPARERPRPAGVFAVAAVSLAAGILVVRLASGDGAAMHGHEGATPDRGDEGAVAPSPSAPSPPELAGEQDAGAVTAAAAATGHSADAGAPVALAPVANAPDAGSPARGTRRRSVIPGTVAYLRCDGLTPKNGRFPCPRDAPFEDAAWRALEGLAACPGADPGSGSLEVRLEFAGEQLVDVRLRGGEREGINFSAVDRCVSPALRRVESVLRPTRMVVAFRLELR